MDGEISFDLGEIDIDLGFGFGEIDVDLDIDITGGNDAEGIDPTQGSEQSDNFVGTEGKDVFNGNGGDDIISGGNKRDTLSGGDGNDYIDGGDRADTLNGDAGDDTIIGGRGGDQIMGGAGNDVIEAGRGQDLVYGGDGDDFITLDNGIDFAYGDAGNDVISAGRHADFVFGGEGEDTLNGDQGDDVLFGGAGADKINGGKGYDISSYSDLTEKGVGVELDAIGEAGSLTIAANSANEWVRVDFAETLTDAQVVIGGISHQDDDPVTARVRNLSDTGFEVRLEEWRYQDGIHGAETLSWLAVESGTHTLENGLTITAGDTNATMDFAEVDLGTDFGTGPTVFSQVVTTNDEAPVVTRMRSVDGDSFQISLENEERAPEQSREDDDIGWIAMDLGGRANQNILTDITPETVTDDTYTAYYGGRIRGEVVVMADVQTFNEEDPAWARMVATESYSNGVRFFVEEEESLDGEEHNTGEAVGYTAMRAGLISGREVDANGKGTGGWSTIGESGNVTFEQVTRDQWFRVNFATELDNAVVNMGLMTDTGIHPVTTQVRNITSTGFEFQIDEWIYLNGYHPTEEVSWMAVEAGDHQLQVTGQRISAGFTTVDGLATKGVEFDADFDGTPVVFAQLSSDNDAIPAESRISDVTGEGFKVRLQEEEAYVRPAGSAEHADETASFIAIQQGGAAADGVLVGETGNNVTHNSRGVSFDSDFALDPVFLAQAQTTDGGDTANVRTASLDANGAAVFIDEETSRDNETAHTTENVGFAALFDGLLYGDQSANTGEAEGDTWTEVEQIQGTETDDVLQAYGSVTVLNGGAGEDILRGGSGSDSFEFFAGNGTDTIERFVHNVDKIDLSRFHETDSTIDPLTFADVRLVQSADDVAVYVGSEDKFLIEDMRVGLLDQDDFVF